MATPKTFILIDDDLINIFIAENTIWRAAKDATIISFNNAVAGLVYIKQHYSLIEHKQTILLLDLDMPIMNGHQFIDEYMKLDEAIRTQIKIVVLSASLNGPNIQLFTKHNCVSRFISKPLLEEQVRSMVK